MEVRALLVIFATTACESQPPPFVHQELASFLRGAADGFTMRDGDWKEDYGDGAFFGTAYNAVAAQDDFPFAAERSRLGLQHNLDVIATESLIGGDANELIMSYNGVIEYVRATGDRAPLEQIEERLANVALAMELVDYHLSPDLAPGWAMNNYGPVAIGSLLGTLFARRAALEDSPLETDEWQTAVRLAERLEVLYWQGDHFAHGVRDGLHLYPGAAAAGLFAQLYLLDANPAFLRRAEEAYAGVQPLRRDDGPGNIRYRSPYSQHDMGAATDDYTTLSSQNYLILALHTLYRATGEDAYLHEVDRLLDFIDGHLRGDWCLADFHAATNVDLIAATCESPCDTSNVCVDGACEADACHPAVLHHWIDGRVADTGDPVLLCSGCNLQLLYVLWERKELARGD
jgi:hypothetical protein